MALITETLQPTSTSSHEAEISRDAQLRQLLGNDYDFARDSGLIDVFYFDPETGQDGLLHTLSGNIRVGSEEERVPEGFHHEPSGVALGKGEVDRTHLAGKSPSDKRRFAEFPYEPYSARVRVDGKDKVSLTTDSKTGKPVVRKATNGMYPKEYDALAVMQTVKRARDERDKAADVRKVNPNGREVMYNEGAVTMLDDKTPMRIRLVMEPDTDKVITAYPVFKPGAMKLSREAVRHYLLDSTVTHTDSVAK